jgi:hypothetical protein
MPGTFSKNSCATHTARSRFPDRCTSLRRRRAARGYWPGLSLHQGLFEGGHRRIAYIGNVTSVFTGQRRFEGFSRALAAFGFSPDWRWSALVRSMSSWIASQ